MSAGPHQPKNFMNIDDVLFYLNEFDQDSNFNRAVGFNGGEVMTAYKHQSPDYIPTIIQECVNKSYKIDLRTNSLWTEDNTINSIIWNSLDNIDFSKYTNKIKFSLSIDKFHNNESANAKLISRICNSDLCNHFEFDAFLIPDNPDDDTAPDEVIYSRFSSLLRSLRANGIKFSDIDLDDIPTRYNFGLYLNNVPFFIETHNFGQWGRAREFGIGTPENEYEHILAQYNIIQHKPFDLDVNNCVKSQSGFVHIIFTPENNGTADFIVPVEKATDGVPYKTGTKCKPWSTLYPEIVKNLQTRFDALKKQYQDITPEMVQLPSILKQLTPHSK